MVSVIITVDVVYYRHWVCNCARSW